MEKDMMQILRKVPLHIDDEIARCIWRQIDGTNIGEMILVAVEYGRILGKREERARRKNLA